MALQPLQHLDHGLHGRAVRRRLRVAAPRDALQHPLRDRVTLGELTVAREGFRAQAALHGGGQRAARADEAQVLVAGAVAAAGGVSPQSPRRHTGWRRHPRRASAPGTQLVGSRCIM